MKHTLFTLLTIFSASSFSIAQNGYSLEFEDVVTLSVESSALVPIGATGSKTYTVPASMVLKISSGCLQWANPTANAAEVFLAVGGETITNIVTAGITAPSLWQPIWANAGTVLTLSYVNDGTSPNSVMCGFISGTLFRKVPN